MSSQPDQSGVSTKSSKNKPSKKVIFGTVLWILAIIGLFFVWKGNNVPVSDTGDPEKTEEVLVINDSEDSDDDEDDDDDGKPQTITIKMFPFELQDFKLKERNGKDITNAELAGKPWAVSFIFTRCAGPCSKITSEMAKLQKKLKDEDIRLVTITVDPKNDTPEKLQKYADAFQADPEKWLFLTGSQEDVYELISTGFKQIVMEETGDNIKKGFEIAHSSNIMLVNAEGIVLGKYNGQIDSDMVKLRKALKKEADSLKEVEKKESTKS